MRKLTFDEKALFFGTGNKKFPSSNIANKNNFFGRKIWFKSFNSKNLIKTFEYSSHNLGLFSLAMSSSIFNFLENLEDYKNVTKYKKYENYQNSSFGKSTSYVKKNHSFSDSLRPSIRFGAYPFRNSITFGLPWFY